MGLSNRNIAGLQFPGLCSILRFRKRGGTARGPQGGIVLVLESVVARARSAFTRPIAILFAVQLACGTLLAPVTTFFPVYLKDLGYPFALISLIMVVQRVTGLGASLAGSPILHRLGSKRAMVVGQACFLVATLVFAARGPLPLVLLWGVSGIGMALTSLSSQSYLLRQANPAYLGLLTALVAWGNTIGATIGNPVAGTLLAHGGWRTLAVVAAIPAVATVVLTGVSLPRSPMRQEPMRHEPLRNAPVRPRGAAFQLSILSIPSMRLLISMRFLATFCYGLALVFVPLQLTAAGASNQLVAAYATVYNVVASLTQLMTGRIADRVNWRAPTIASCVVLAVGALTAGALPRSIPAVFAGATLSIAAAWSLSSLIPTQIAKAVAPADHAAVLSTMQLAWYSATILGGLVGGLMYEAWIGLPMLAGGLAAAATVAIAPAFIRRVRSPAARAA
jgi:MFS family permease